MAEMVVFTQPQTRELQMACNFRASPRRLILNKVRINGNFRWRKPCQLPGWMKSSSYYSATAEGRNCDLTHIMSIPIGK